MTDSFEPDAIVERNKAARKTYYELCKEAAKKETKKSEYALAVERFKCRNLMVLELLKGCCDETPFLRKFDSYKDVRHKVFWKMKFDGIIHRFKLSGKEDHVVSLNIDSAYLIKPKSPQDKRFSSEVYEAIAKRKEENKVHLASTQNQNELSKIQNNS